MGHMTKYTTQAKTLLQEPNIWEQKNTLKDVAA